MINRDEACAQLKAVIEAHPAEFHTAVIEGLAAAGSQQNRDEGTLAAVLAPIQSYLTAHGIPAIDSSEDLDAFEFWLAVAGRPIPWDPFKGNGVEAEERWRLDVSEGKTRMGFTEWWDDQIETARHNL